MNGKRRKWRAYVRTLLGVAAMAPSQKATGLRASLPGAVWAALFFLFGVSGCVFAPGAVVDGYAGAEVQTWYDADGDGEQDQDESPLPWVTIRMDYELSITDSSGRGRVGVLKPGCARKCWRGESVSVNVPPGYRATTPTEMDLTDQEGVYRFGFQVEEGVRLLSFPDEPDWFRAFFNRGLDLLAFHYAADEGRLAVSFNTAGVSSEDALYRDVFDVIHTLKQIEGVSVDWVEITRKPSGEVVVCEMSEVEAWTGKILSAEIVSTHCRSPQSPTASPTVSRAAEPTASHTSESVGYSGTLEGRWCFEGEDASFELRLQQADDQIRGTFFLLKYCEVEGVRSACRIREGEIVGTPKEDKVEIAWINPEYEDTGSALLTMGRDLLAWEVVEYPQEYYLPAQFSLKRCDE
jgi:hypothetical protein